MTDQDIINAIPCNWCDPLLTGKDRVMGDPPYNSHDIENLLNGIRDRIEDTLKATEK
jgi:hypothetical protein